MKLQIKSWWDDKVLYEAEASSILELLHLAVKDSANLTRANFDGANLTGANLTRANLTGANFDGANLTRANLTRANLTRATVIETGETWKQYLEEVLPALLTAGGKALTEVLTPMVWDCHSWENCPMAHAFSTNGINGVPILLRPRAEQFIRFFDAKLIPIEAVGNKTSQLKEEPPSVESVG